MNRGIRANAARRRYESKKPATTEEISVVQKEVRKSFQKRDKNLKIPLAIDLTAMLKYISCEFERGAFYAEVTDPSRKVGESA